MDLVSYTSFFESALKLLRPPALIFVTAMDTNPCRFSPEVVLGRSG